MERNCAILIDIIQIKTEDFYKDVEKIFNTSDYKAGRPSPISICEQIGW